MRGKDVFCVVSFGGTMRSAMSVLLEKTAFGGNASLQLADPGSAHFLEHPTTACPRRATLAASKVPAILRDLQVASFLFPMPWAVIFSLTRSSSAGRTILVVRILVNTCVLRQMRLWCIDSVS